MNEPPNFNQDVTTEQLVGVVAAVIVILVPMFLLVAFPENKVVSTLFGGGKFLVFWGLFFGLVYVYDKDLEKIIAKWARRRRKTNK